MRVHLALSEDADTARVWVNGDFVSGLCSPVRIQANGRSIYCDLRYATLPYITRYNQSEECGDNDFDISREEPFVTLSEYYRNQLHVHEGDTVTMHFSPAPFFYGSWRVCLTHPDCVTRFSAILGMLSVFLGVISIFFAIWSLPSKY